MCEYCSGDGVIVIEDNIIDGEGGIQISLDVGLGDLIIDADYTLDGVSGFITTHINYCPMCGRKL